MNAAEPLRVVTGPDRLLGWLLPIATGIAVAALYQIEMQSQQRLATIFLILGTTLLAQWWPRGDADLEVILFAGERLKWRQPEGDWHLGSLGNNCWVSKRYAVIPAQGQGWRRTFLISRSRQDVKTYRMLVSRIRLAGNPRHSLR